MDIDKFLNWYFDGNAWLWIVVFFAGVLIGCFIY